MKLTDNVIKQIEGLLVPGVTVEVQGASPSAIRVHKRPTNESDIDLMPTLADSNGQTVLFLTLQKAGEDPIHIAEAVLPAGYWIRGIKGAIATNDQEASEKE